MSDYIILLDPIRGPHLEHKAHKYIKREWIKGKWRYWYDTKITGKEYLRRMEANSRGIKATYDKNSLLSRPSRVGKPNKYGFRLTENDNRGFYAKKWQDNYLAYKKSLVGNISKFIADGKLLISNIIGKYKM